MDDLKPLELVEQTTFPRTESPSAAAFGVKPGGMLGERGTSTAELEAVGEDMG